MKGFLGGGVREGGLKFRFHAFLGWFDLSRSYKEYIYIFLWVGAGGIFKKSEDSW